LRIWKQIFIFLLIIGFSSLATAAPYAAVVMDAATGKILESENAHKSRFPASLTKKITLLLIFEALASGRLKPTSRLYVSAYAASQPPSKLGLKAGERVPLETIIMGLVTRSANDAAMVAAEALGNTQAGFARMMNAKARELGMTKTVFRNPSGLPDPHQVTTAHDMAILALALYRNHPQHYHRFKVRAFTYKGQTIENHNRLLGKVKGVDCCKTGYTRASGFNLTASAKRNNHRLIVVVMGGANRHWRDRRVTELFEKHFKNSPPIREALYEETADAEETEGNFESKVIDDAIQNIIVENHQIKEEVPATQTSTPTVTRAAWVIPEAPVQITTKSKNKPKITTTGVQVGRPFDNKLQATLAAQRVANFTGGTVDIKRTKKRKKTLFLARVKGLTMAQARTVCKDLKKGQQQECFPFSQSS
jgi:D-alanyl-D-alanine carboxypeptidase